MPGEMHGSMERGWNLGMLQATKNKQTRQVLLPSNESSHTGRPACSQPGGAGATTIPGLQTRTHGLGSCGAFFTTASLGAKGARVEAAGMGPAGRRCRGWREAGAAPLAGGRLGLSARAATLSARVLHMIEHTLLELGAGSAAGCRLAADRAAHTRLPSSACLGSESKPRPGLTAVAAVAASIVQDITTIVSAGFTTTGAIRARAAGRRRGGVRTRPSMLACSFAIIRRSHMPQAADKPLGQQETQQTRLRGSCRVCSSLAHPETCLGRKLA